MMDKIQTGGIGPAPTNTNSGTRATVVEEGTEFNGTLKSKCPLIIRGSVEGTIDAPDITVAPGGTLTGTAKVGSLVSEGALSGSFEADSIRLAGKVGSRTKIRTKSLEAKLSAPGQGIEVTFGDVELEVGADPRDTKAAVPKAEPKDLKPKVADGKPKPEGVA